MGRKPRILIEPAREALESSRGRVTHAADKLGVHFTALYRFMDKHPELKEITHAYHERIVDNAELRFDDKVLAGEPWAIQFALRTLGKNRGYVEKQEIENTGRPLVEVREIVVALPAPVNESPSETAGNADEASTETLEAEEAAS